MRECRALWTSARHTLAKLSRSGALASCADVCLDLPSGIAVDVLPVLQRLLEHLAGDPTEQVTGDVVDEVGALGVVTWVPEPLNLESVKKWNTSWRFGCGRLVVRA
jgi:hypothetical protein